MCIFAVAPFAGAWIEITIKLTMMDLVDVAPFAGAWIEIAKYGFLFSIGQVAPFAGAWIEMLSWTKTTVSLKSLPLRERGLKYRRDNHDRRNELVAPFAGAWIEIQEQQCQ